MPSIADPATICCRAESSHSVVAGLDDPHRAVSGLRDRCLLDLCLDAEAELVGANLRVARVATGQADGGQNPAPGIEALDLLKRAALGHPELIFAVRHGRHRQGPDQTVDATTQPRCGV